MFKVSERHFSLCEEVKKLSHELEILHILKSGKEASVYKVLFDQMPAALKVYTSPEQRTFTHMHAYLEGKHYKKASHRKAMEKGNAFSKKLQHSNWIRREYALLQKMWEKGASVPKPLLCLSDALLMEYLGDDNSPAPRLVDCVLSGEEAHEAWEKLQDAMRIFLDVGIVHGDLSPFNVLWWQSTPYVIDFPQAIDCRHHPDSQSFLLRDIRNMSSYFKKYFEVDEHAVYEKISRC